MSEIATRMALLAGAALARVLADGFRSGERCSPHSIVRVDEMIRQVSEIAARQHGLIRTDQIGPEELDRLRYLAKRGVIVRNAKGVYRVAGAPVTWHQSLQAGVWSLGPSCAVSHRAAARLHGFDRFDTEAAEFTIGRSKRGRVPSDIECVVHTTSIRLAGDHVTVDGLPTTSANRTIIDLARAGVRSAALEAAIDSAIRLRLTTLEALAVRMAKIEGPRRWGLGRLYAALAASGGHTVLERRFIELMQEARLPAPTPQVVHRISGRHIARVDFAFTSHDVIVEVSGGRGHSSPSERAKDARRRNDLQRLGLVVLEFTFEQVMHDPASVIEVVRATLAERAIRRSA